MIPPSSRFMSHGFSANKDLIPASLASGFPAEKEMAHEMDTNSIESCYLQHIHGVRGQKLSERRTSSEGRFIKGIGRFIVSLTWAILLAVILFVTYLISHL